MSEHHRDKLTLKLLTVSQIATIHCLLRPSNKADSMITRTSKQTLLALVSFWLVNFSLAQDPVYTSCDQTNRYRRIQHVSSRSAPWRKSSSRQRSATSYYQQQQRRDYSSYLVDYEEASRDRRSRLWSVNFKTRNVGELSVTSRIVWATLAAFGLQVFRPGITSWGIKLSDPILQGQELYRLVTPIFLHGGVLHLFTNMISLQRMGNDVEKLFGSGRYLATYVAAGVAGNLFSAIKSPNPSLGASGAVFGVVGAYFVFLNRNDWLLGSYGQAMTNAITQTIAANIFLGAINPVIDNWAHLGGALGGAAMAYVFGPRLYLAEFPGGGRVVVDRPIVRLPRSLEALPGRVGHGFQRIARRMQVGRYTFDLPDKPWRNKRRPTRVNTPNRSIKPAKVP